MTPSPAAHPCAVEGCRRRAQGHRHKYCSTHAHRAAEGKPLEAPVRQPYTSPFDRLFTAAVDLAAADSEDDEAFRKGKERLRKAFRDALERELARQRILATTAALGPHEGATAVLHASPDASPRPDAGRMNSKGQGQRAAERAEEARAPSDRQEAAGRRARRRRPA